MAKYRKLGRTSAQRKALIRNQVTALLNNGKIITTEAKAKEIAMVYAAMKDAKPDDKLVQLNSIYAVDSPVFIKADEALNYGDVMSVLRSVKNANYTNVALETK